MEDKRIEKLIHENQIYIGQSVTMEILLKKEDRKKIIVGRLEELTKNHFKVDGKLYPHSEWEIAGIRNLT